MDFELERLRIELRHLKQMKEVAQEESLDASREVRSYLLFRLLLY